MKRLKNASKMSSKSITWVSVEYSNGLKPFSMFVSKILNLENPKEGRKERNAKNLSPNILSGKHKKEIFSQ